MQLELSPEPEIDESAISLLALAAISGVGFATVRAFYNAFDGNLPGVWEASGDELREHLQTARIPQAPEIVRQILERSKRVLSAAREHYAFLQERRNVSVLFRGKRGYPPRLLALPQPPVWLFVEGDPGLLHDPAMVAVVGTRAPSDQGLDAAKRLSVELVRSGCVILSGLAEGIDEVGHRTAVDYGAPTVAILGHGIDVVFPASTSGLRREMVNSGGAIVSEYLPGDSYVRERFVQRNRIQAALSCLVAVIEGQRKSGTAHTVRFARQLERPLFGVRLGDPVHSAQQELLDELERLDWPVFDLLKPTERDALRVFLEDQLPLNLGPHPTGTPRLFRSVIKEIRRLAVDYDATDEDYAWLAKYIEHLRTREARDNAG